MAKVATSKFSDDLMDGIYRDVLLTKLLLTMLPPALTCVPPTVYCNKLMEPSWTSARTLTILKTMRRRRRALLREMSWLDDYLNLDEVKKAVGSKVDLFTSCDDTVFNNFILSGDEASHSSSMSLRASRKGGSCVALRRWQGHHCNWLGNHYWSDALDYSEHRHSAVLHWFMGQQPREASWWSRTTEFYVLKVWCRPWFLDQPYDALEMVNRWVSGSTTFSNENTLLCLITNILVDFLIYTIDNLDIHRHIDGFWGPWPLFYERKSCSKEAEARHWE